VPNFIEIGRTVWKISHFNDFQNGRRPPSRIFNIQDGGRRILTVMISGESRYRGCKYLVAAIVVGGRSPPAVGDHLQLRHFVVTSTAAAALC